MIDFQFPSSLLKFPVIGTQHLLTSLAFSLVTVNLYSMPALAQIPSIERFSNHDESPNTSDLSSLRNLRNIRYSPRPLPPDHSSPTTDGGGGSYAIRPLPPDQGAPGTSGGGGSRGDCPNTDIPLTPLAPVTTTLLDSITPPVTEILASTTHEYPTFWFYVPYSLTSEFPAELILQDEEGYTIHQVNVTDSLSSTLQPGIVSVALPSTGSPLEVGKRYQWFFKVYCSSTDDMPVFVSGWIERVAPNPLLVNELASVSLPEQAVLYANNGIWHEALTILGELRREHPADPDIAAAWTSLLQSIKLDQIASEPLIPCCSP
jgi:Domain of Unknown Function (DUF928)